jgi:hypothetical protein
VKLQITGDRVRTVQERSGPVGGRILGRASSLPMLSSCVGVGACRDVLGNRQMAAARLDSVNVALELRTTRVQCRLEFSARIASPSDKGARDARFAAISGSSDPAWYGCLAEQA